MRVRPCGREVGASGPQWKFQLLSDNGHGVKGGRHIRRRKYGISGRKAKPIRPRHGLNNYRSGTLCCQLLKRDRPINVQEPYAILFHKRQGEGFHCDV